jgi:parallel beta-helix repeat protein
MGDIVRSVRFLDAWARVGLAVSMMVCLTGHEAAAVGAQPSVESASPVEITECFQTIETDAVLAHDLVCEVHGLGRAAIEIVASNVTVDLGGHTLFGYPFGQLGIRAEGFDGVTVKNGTIDGFVFGMTFAEGSDVTAEDLTIRNLEIQDSAKWVIGVWLNGCQNAVVRDATFEFLPTGHKSAVEAWSCSDFSVDAIALHGGGGLGVEINFGSTGEVVNSRFLGLTGAGVLIEGSRGARIAHNEFVRNEFGVAATSYESEPITGLTIEENTIENGFRGIWFQGISESTVRDNVVRGNGMGVGLYPYYNCQDPPGPECYYSTGNLITGNTVLGNSIDLYHHDNCVPNTWEWNICRWKDGAEIPPCWGDWRRPSRRLKPGSP